MHSTQTEPVARCFALVPCAGSGARAGTALAKQYVLLEGQPMVAHTLAALASVARIAGILVVVAPDDDEFERRVVLPSADRFGVARRGGASRAATVAAGIDELARQGARKHD